MEEFNKSAEKKRLFLWREKTVAIFLLCIYAISVTELYELLKINILLEHYAETKIKHDGISFLDFCIMHYVTDDGNNNDNDRDKRLPFKSPVSLFANAALVFIIQRNEIHIEKPTLVNNSIFFIYPDNTVVSNFYSQVWHPPKIA